MPKFPQYCGVLLIALSSCTATPPKPVEFESLSDEARRLPEHAISGIQVNSGLALQLFASEPMMINPTNIAVDENGRVWVCEAFNYRTNLNPDYKERKEGDRILILEDTNGDGAADQSTVFYQGPEINSALGIWVAGPKVIVSCSPSVLVFTDEDGDGRADKKEVLFSGIKGVQHDHGVHAFTFGPDGKFYFNFGNEGYQLLDANGQPITDQFGRPVVAEGKPFRQGMVFRCNPDGSQLEVLGHNFRNNFELAVDPYGNIWQSDNDDDGNRATRINFVMEYGNYGFTDEITGAGWRQKRIGMHKDIPQRHWHLNDPGVVPNLLHTGSGSPTGMVYYTGDLLSTFKNQMIHCEPGHNVVRSYPTALKGAGFTAQINNLVKGKDEWFRPSDICVAPDGSLFIADWYDPGVGGHKMGDPDRGRVYRLAPSETTYDVDEFKLENPEQAINGLLSPNLARQYLSWHYLHAMQDKAIPYLEDLWTQSEVDKKARALWLLGNIEGKAPHYISLGLEHDDPNLRITALRLARQRASENLPEYISKLVSDRSPQVRREVAIALYGYDHEKLPQWWSTLAGGYDGNDRWYLEALGIASDRHPDAILDYWLDQVGDNWNSPMGRDIIWRVRGKAALPLLANLIADGKSSEEEIKSYLRAFHFHPNDQSQVLLAGLLGLDHPMQIKIDTYVLGLLSPEYVSKSGSIKQRLNNLLPKIKGSEEYLDIVRNQNLPEQNQYLLDMAVNGSDAELSQEAANLLLNRNGLELIIKALDESESTQRRKIMMLLGRSGESEVREFLRAQVNLSRDSVNSELAVEALNQTWGGQEALYRMLENNELPASLRQKTSVLLLSAFNSDIREAMSVSLDNEQGFQNLSTVLEKLDHNQGAANRGSEIFSTHCASCHQVNGQGTNFGPDLSEIGSKLAKKALLASIAQPSAGINFGYEGYSVHLKDGVIHTGFIASETPESLILRTMGGLSRDLDREDIASIEPLNQSLMPAGLHLAMSEQELVDLISYLETLKTAELASSH